MANMGRILSTMPRIKMLTVKVSSAILVDVNLRRAVVKTIREWCHRWATKAKVLLIVKAQIKACASKNIMELMVSTQKWGKKQLRDLPCP